MTGQVAAVSSIIKNGVSLLLKNRHGNGTLRPDPRSTNTQCHVYRDHPLISIVHIACIAGQHYLEIPMH